MFDVDAEKGLTLIELAEVVSLEDVRAATGCQFEVRVEWRDWRGGGEEGGIGGRIGADGYLQI